MTPIVFIVTEMGKYKGVFTQIGLDTYIASLDAKIEFTDWKWEESKPYDRVCEGFVVNGRRRDATPSIRVVKTLVDGWVF